MKPSRHSVHYSSKTDEWPTPRLVFDPLNKEFEFELDVCASRKNHKCALFFTKKQNGLKREWGRRSCWMNPPYGRTIQKWMKKAYRSSKKGALVVCLVPARTDTRWWHKYAMRSSEIRLVKGRIKFEGGKSCAPFPSAIVIFNPLSSEKPILRACTFR